MHNRDYKEAELKMCPTMTACSGGSDGTSGRSSNGTTLTGIYLGDGLIPRWALLCLYFQN